MTFPRSIEHSKNYIVTMQILESLYFDDKINNLKLNYMATSFDIKFSGGSKFVHQKGRSNATVVAGQPKGIVNIRCLMTDPDFSVIIQSIVLNQRSVLLSVGKLNYNNEIPHLREDSALIFEAIGYFDTASISARVGEYVIVDFVMNIDDINILDPNALPIINT